jgi:hypothetical protein
LWISSSARFRSHGFDGADAAAQIAFVGFDGDETGGALR